MKLWKNLLKKEEGSATIEFLGILPLIFLVIVIVWQFVVSVQGVVVAKSAANEAAKVYSLTKDSSLAADAASKIVNMNGDNLSFEGSPISGGKNFTATVNVKINFIFLPKKLFGGKTPTYSFSSSASGRVIE